MQTNNEGKIFKICWSNTKVLILSVWKSSLLYASQNKFFSETYDNTEWMPEYQLHVTNKKELVT